MTDADKSSHESKLQQQVEELESHLKTTHCNLGKSLKSLKYYEDNHKALSSEVHLMYEQEL